MRCVHCDEPIDPLSQAHSAHEPGCPVDIDAEDWACGCDAYSHIRCCRAKVCRIAVGLGASRVVPGVKVPFASTRGLPVMRHP